MSNVETPLGGAADMQPRPVGRTKRRRLSKDGFWAVVFLAPAFLSIFVLRLSPAIGAFWSSLFSGLPGSVVEPTFSGLANYQALLADKAFLATILRTLFFNVVVNPLQLAVALFIAFVLTRNVPARGLWRTLVFIPATLPIVGSSIAWGVALQPNGPVNAIIEALGGNAQPFFSSPTQALASIMLVVSWIGIGYWMIFLIAGLESISEEYYEAARLDRAGPVRTFVSITVPLLKRPLLFVLVANTVANFVLFAPIQLITNGGPQNSTNLLMFDAYRTTFYYNNRNLGAAEVVILTAIMLFFVALQFRLLREEKTR
ncbi:carbohydrate ABC transporter permease [Cellulomonas sp. McL0617]|uniref:carbohydrate ABC transporter permease n=1 Tax=Cellulomonas sp. McL0617 TaxID=3415675 RepID=UPI003CF8114A